MHSIIQIIIYLLYVLYIIHWQCSVRIMYKIPESGWNIHTVYSNVYFCIYACMSSGQATHSPSRERGMGTTVGSTQSLMEFSYSVAKKGSVSGSHSSAVIVSSLYR